MLKPSDYTPARRRIMQAIVWGIFALTLGLAGVVAQSNRRANRLPLTQSATVDDVTVKLPDKWFIRPRADDGRTIVQMTDSPETDDSAAGGEADARTITVLCDRLQAPMSPMQYLSAAFGVSPPGVSSGSAGAGPGEISSLTTVKVAGQPGVLVTLLSSPDQQQQGDFAKDLLACAVLPSRRAIVVRLSGRGPVSLQDRELVKSVAGSIAVVHEPGVVKEDQPITLPRLGISLTPPRGLAAIEENDPDRTDRLLWPVSAMQQLGQGLEQSWATVELVECLVSTSHGENMQAAIQTLLLTRDPVWRDANIVPEGPNVWRADVAKATAENSGVPRRAYLLSDANGLALLAIFRGGYNGGEFENDWKAIQTSAKFPATPPIKIADLEFAGAEQANRFRDEGYEKLLADRVDEQWWLWTGTGERPHVGWSHWEVSLSSLDGKMETRLRRTGGIVRRITQEFSYRQTSEPPRYRASAMREDTRGHDVLRSFQQTASLTGTNLILAAHAHGEEAQQWKSTAPPQFVPGALLPMLLDQLSDRPMLLRTDSFPGFETVGAPEPLSLRIETIMPPNTASTRHGDSESPSVRCVAVEVNGSGQISRWYFRADGEFDRVELPGGVQGVLSTDERLKFDFGKDGQMAP